MYALVILTKKAPRKYSTNVGRPAKQIQTQLPNTSTTYITDALRISLNRVKARLDHDVKMILDVPILY